MANLTKEEILEGVSKMSVLELTELIKSMEDRFGVTAAAPVAAAAAGAAPAAAAEAQSSFTVMLTSAGASKIPVIKVVREITGLGLKEAKDLVDGAPKAVKEGLSKDEADKMKAKFEGSGATIEIK
ncbi:MAG: 50S ribosomal protein L7/L12 [Candidatus Firestonebacteria bacterium GWA2_43_8]|nr:MAG: 50S ribosomal protein L7/L12 [Candidatus Firestonebacteria bacterium GWA2_43_8]